ncbi:MAG TPA: hypothetical protein DCP92_15100 [Nitrospiraceae bacterium]|jgi:hypothetical protein|nr:hypothetical protein [Nitrospiraceae bacterium]
MLINKGGQTVSKGTYWELRKGQRIDIADQGTLPGDKASTYLKMPSGVMLLLGPIIGLLYAILMPIIGIATVITLAVGKVLGGLYDLAAKSISFGWRPLNSYLSGKKKKKKDTK